MSSHLWPLCGPNCELTGGPQERWRTDSKYWAWSLGYRGLNVPLNFGEIGLEPNYPLVSDWLWLQANANAGYGSSNAYFADGEAGLELRFGFLGLDFGYRDLYLSAPGGNVNWGAPQGTVRLMF